MLLLGQLLDVLPDNELVTLRSAGHSPIIYFEEKELKEIKEELTKDARKAEVADLFSDIQYDSYGRHAANSFTTIVIKPNGYFIRRTI